MKQTVKLAEAEFEALIDYEEASRYLGYGKTKPEDEMLTELKSCAKNLLKVMQPAFCYQLAQIERKKVCTLAAEVELAVLLEGAEYLTDGTEKEDLADSDLKPSGLSGRKDVKRLILPGKSIRKHMGKSRQAVCACLTLGREADLWIEELQQASMLESLLTDALANAAVERLRFLLERTVEEEIGCSINWLFGIGYGDLPIELQKDFLEAMQAERKIGLSCNDRQVLIPMKSVTGFMAVQNELLLDGQQAKGQTCTDRGCAACSMIQTCTLKSL